MVIVFWKDLKQRWLRKYKQCDFLKGILEIDCKEPETIIKSLKPEIDDSSKFDVDIKSEKDKIVLTIESEKMSGLLAGINSYMRLIRVAKESIGE